jgi:hypothetical protein
MSHVAVLWTPLMPASKRSKFDAEMRRDTRRAVSGRCVAVSLRWLILALPLVALAGCGGSSEASTAQTASAAAQSKPEDTVQELREAEEHLYPGQPLLGKAWVATRLHMIFEIDNDYKSAHLEGTACGVLHTLQEEGIHAECQTRWVYEGEQFSTRSWVTVRPNENVSEGAVAQGPTTSPSGRMP